MRRAALAIDEWRKELAPSDGLRRWFGHEPEGWEEFARRYRQELRGPEAAAALRELVKRARAETVTLVFGARDRERNNAVVLEKVVGQRLRRR